MKTRYIIALAAGALILAGCQREELAEPGVLPGKDGVVTFAPSVGGILSAVKSGYTADAPAATGTQSSLTLTSEDGGFTLPMGLSVTSLETGGGTKATLINENGGITDAQFATAVSDTFMVAAWDKPASGDPAQIIPDKTISGYTTTDGKYQKVMYRTKDVTGASLATPYWMTMQPMGELNEGVTAIGPADDEYIWKSGETKTFYAYANLPESGATMALLSKGAGQTMEYTVPAAASAQTDIMMGFYNGTGGGTGTAGIEFKHPFTAVRFMQGKMEDVEGIRSITISGLAKSGSVTMDADGVISNWTITGDDYSATATLSDGENLLEVDETTKLIGMDSEGNYNGAFLLIPQDLSAHKVTVAVVLATVGGDVTVYADITSGTWRAGMTNTYTLGYNATDPNLLSGKFSISATEYIQFSRGNLFCTDKGSGNYEFSFEEKQYDYRCRYGLTGDKAVLGGDGGTTPQHTSGLFLWIPRTSSYATADWGAFTSYSSGRSDDKVNDVLDFGGVFPGSDWTTLTSVQWNYLLDHHTYKFVTVIGVYGLAIAPDDYEGEISASYTTLEQWAVAEAAGIVFLPIYGYYNANGTSGYVETSESCYWSSSPHASTANYAIALHFGNLKSTPLTPSMVVNERWRIYGQYVRLVQMFPKPDDVLEFKDLGLTSGTLWANMNLGAKRICDYGDYYAWGATEPYYTSYTLSEPSTDYHTRSKTFNGWNKTDGYTQANAPYYSGGKFTKYNDTDNLKTLEASDDVATQKLGPEYSIPTVAQFQELIDECEWKHVVYEGVSAYKVSGKKEGYKDMFIILPVCGRVAGTNESHSRYADYWSNCAYYSNHIYAQYLEGANESTVMKAGGGIGRYLGFPIRPVKNVSD